ncbi:MAG: hypothetical protein AAF479_09460 [Pseudomonadota bacterium]
MSDTESRKSMDDVLASIRRIVRAEKDPETIEDAATSPGDVMPSQTMAAPVEEAAPLELTPEMRMAEESTPEVETPVLDETPPPMDTAPAEAIPAPVAPPMDPAMIGDMVREIVMEQLSGPDGDKLIRNVIKDELYSGEIGANISKNVLALIQSEVGKALGK